MMNFLKSKSTLAWLNYSVLLYATIMVMATFHSVAGYQLEQDKSGFKVIFVTIFNIVKLIGLIMHWIVVIFLTRSTQKEPASQAIKISWVAVLIFFGGINLASGDFMHLKRVKIWFKTGDQHAETAWSKMNSGDFEGALKSFEYAQRLGCHYNCNEYNSVKTLLYVWDMMGKGKPNDASQYLCRGCDIETADYSMLAPSSSAVKKFPPLNIAAKQSIERFVNDSIHLLIPFNSDIRLQLLHRLPKEPQENEPNTMSKEFTEQALRLYKYHLYATASKELGKAIAADSNYTLARYNKVFADVMKEQPNDSILDEEKLEEAMRVYTSWARDNVKTANDCLLLGFAAFKNHSGLGVEAIDYSIELDSASIEANMLKVYWLTDKGSLSLDDLPYFERVLQLDHNNFMATKTIGDMWYFENDYPKALEWYNKALKVQPSNINALFNKAVVLLKCKQWEQAHLVLTQAMQAADKPDGPLTFNYACSLFFIGRYEEAIDAFNLAHELETNKGDCEQMIGLAYLKQVNRSQAMRHLCAALDGNNLVSIMLIPLAEE